MMEVLVVVLGLVCAALAALLWRARSAPPPPSEGVSESMENAFERLASKALLENNKEFLTLAKNAFENLKSQSEKDLQGRQEAVKNLVEPINKALEANKQMMNEIENKRHQAYGDIKQQIENMTRGQKELRDETGKLVNALHRPQARGRYGEITLRKVVELAGMNQYCDFDEQASVQSDGGTLRPDMVVNMPNKRTLIVDAKMPLDNYLKAIEAETEEQRREHLQQHAKDVRSHIDTLSRKSYWEQLEQTPDFVVMFIGGDQFLHSALEHQPDLLEYAMKSKIILTTPGSLMGLLRAVAYGWRQEEIAENLLKIQKLAKDLHDRAGNFAEHIDKVGKSLNSSMKSYNSAVGSFQSRLIPTVRQLAEHGVSKGGELPEIRQVDTVTRQIDTSERDDT